MTKKRLLIATDNFLPRWDGIARFLIEILPTLNTVFDVTIIAPRFPGRISDVGAKVHFFEIRNMSIGDFSPAKPDKKMIQRLVEETDIVWVQTIGPIGYSTLDYAQRMKKPTAVYTHSIEWELVPNSVSFRFLKRILHTLTKKAVKRLYNKATIMYAPSEETAEKFALSGVKVKKKIITLGVDTKKFQPSKDKEKSKKKIGISPDRVVIGYTGRLAREKDLRTLYRAYTRLQKLFPNLTLLIVGDGVDAIKKMFHNKENIMMTGAKDDVTPYLEAMDIYVLPSLTETTSLSTLEAMSTGLVVFATRVGFIKNYVKEGENGYLFPKGNAYLLSKKMEVIIKDEKLRERIGRKARETVEKKFRFEDTAQKIKEALIELAENK